jgi:hypothetical protein
MFRCVATIDFSLNGHYICYNLRTEYLNIIQNVLLQKLKLNSEFSFIPNLYALSVQKQSFNVIIFQV